MHPEPRDDPYEHWPPDLCDLFKQQILENKVRLLCGFFEVMPGQLGPLLRSCGASGQSPIMQIFKVDLGFNGKDFRNYISHPHYIVIFGPAEVRLAHDSHQPNRPPWLKFPDDLEPGPSWEASFRVKADQCPQWPPLNQNELAEIGVHEWPHLHRVNAKKANMEYWMPHVHIVRAWIESRGRPSGKGRQVAKAKRWVLKKAKLREGG